MPTSLHQRQQQQKPLVDPFPLSPRSSSFNYVFHHRTSSLFARSGLLLLLLLLSLLLLLGVFLPWIRTITPSLFPPSPPLSHWRDYTLAQAAAFVGGKNGTIILCAVSHPYLPFLQNWLISISRQKHQNEVLVIAEDYATLYKVNQKWPGHAVLIPPVPDSQTAHKFGSQGFFNFTSRRPRHLLDILELGYNVMYNDVDMVWLADPFPYLKGNHDVYFTDDMTVVKPLNHPHSLPQPGKKGRTYICSCMIFLRPTNGAKAVLMKWIEELQLQPWSKKSRSNDQPAFNWALNKTAGQLREYVDDTEDYINIMLDDKQNHLLQMGVVLTTATLIVSAFVVLVAIFGMNIKVDLFDENKSGTAEFVWTVGGGVAGSLFLYVVAVSWCKHKGLLD